SSQRWSQLRLLMWALACAGIGALLVSHGHYTVDILIGYYAGTRMYRTFHTLVNNPELKVKSVRNYYSEAWWYRIFQYFEANVGDRVPNTYSSPIPFWSTPKLP
ncbi:unnamed protein product, partial [Allacma fusca]